MLPSSLLSAANFRNPRLGFASDINRVEPALAALERNLDSDFGLIGRDRLAAFPRHRDAQTVPVNRCRVGAAEADEGLALLVQQGNPQAVVPVQPAGVEVQPGAAFGDPNRFAD